MIWWQVLVVLFISVFWFLYDTCYLRSESDHFRSGRSSTWISSHSGSSQSRWSASRLNLYVTNGRIFFTRVVVVCVCVAPWQILGVGLVNFFQVLLFFFCDRKIWWGKYLEHLWNLWFRDIAKKNSSSRRSRTQLKCGTGKAAFHAKGSFAFQKLRGSDAPAPASSPPPAAPANSVNISDGLAPAREAGANNDGRGGRVALFFGVVSFFVNLSSICLVKVRYC